MKVEEYKRCFMCKYFIEGKFKCGKQNSFGGFLHKYYDMTCKHYVDNTRYNVI